jgi:hypothetical protein
MGIFKENIKLWHDDVRRAPDGWVWARTNEEAREKLLHFNVVEISMDHDMGGHNLDPEHPEAIYYAGEAGEDGTEMVKWMCEKEIFPAKITIHSWNPDGAKRMQALFMDHGIIADYVPYAIELELG